MPIRIQQFSGMVPRLSSEMLPESAAALADGCVLTSGKLDAPRAHLDVAACGVGTKTIYKRGGQWLSWVNDVDVVETPVSNDAYDRLYLTGDGEPKVRGIFNGSDLEVLLGVPAPDAACTAQAVQKSGVSWTRRWQYQYEEPDGTVSQSGELAEGDYGGEIVAEVVAGQSYRMQTQPAKVAGVSADAVFVAYFDAYSGGDVPSYLGRVYPDISLYKKQSDLYVDGALVSLEQVNSSGLASVSFALDYDTSRESEYRKDRAYVYTWVSRFGEEGPPSPASELVEVSPVQDVRLSGLPTEAPAGYSNLIQKRIYRTETTAAGTMYRMVGDVDLDEAGFTDRATSSELLGILDTTDWNPPPSDLRGLCVTANGVGCGFTEYAVHFSEPYLLHAWPAKYEFECQSRVVAVLPAGTGVIVLTENEPEVIAGETPATMQRIRIPVQQGCASKRGAVVYGGGAVYPTPDTIGLISGATYTDIAAAYFSRDVWQGYSPADMLAAQHDQQLLLYTASGGLIADLKNGLIVSDTQTAPTAFWQDAENDTLYFAENGKIRQWRGGTGTVPVRWRSKTWTFSRPSAPVSVQVFGSVWPVTVRLFADGEQVLEISLSNSSLKKLPVLRRTERWAVEVETSGRIDEIVLATAGGKL